jgi:hypothetical protein
MALMSREVYDALREIGISDDQALKTAEALAVPNKDIAEIRTDMAVTKSTIEQLQHRLTTMAWSIGLGFSLVLAVLILELNGLWQLLQRVH